jgi:hypothetical protein
VYWSFPSVYPLLTTVGPPLESPIPFHPHGPADYTRLDASTVPQQRRVVLKPGTCARISLARRFTVRRSDMGVPSLVMVAVMRMVYVQHRLRGM